jgi:dolichol-phosphate mannosyltransferase
VGGSVFAEVKIRRRAPEPMTTPNSPNPVALQMRARPAREIHDAKRKTVLVVPTYNERANIGELAQSFFAHVRGAQLLIVDDASPDGTADYCDSLRAEYPDLRVLRRTGQRGLGRAYLAGMAWGLENGYEVIGTMDGDLSHDPAYLPRMLALAEEADVVIGSRYIRDGGTINWQVRRIILSWLANRYAARLLRIPAHDLTSGFRLYRRWVLQSFRVDEVKSSGYSFLVELLYRSHRSGARIAESAIVFYDRTMGASKLRTREIYLGAFSLLRLRFSKVRSQPRSADEREVAAPGLDQQQ